jgi:AcrR family transcriptional regulator
MIKEEKKIKKKDITRAKILSAARKIFAKYSYDAGSVRMIAKEGGFEFALIRYYYPNKAELFRTVIKGACEEVAEVHANAMVGMEIMRPEEGFSLYLDRLMDHHFKDPTALHILANNIYLPQDPDVDIPGYEFLPHMLSETRKQIEKQVNISASQEELNLFCDSLNAHLIFFLGSSSCQAQLLGLEPDSQEYFKWVKNTLMYIYLPHLRRLLFF